MLVSHTHDLSEWAASGFLGLSAIGVIGFTTEFADADVAYFDPRPPVWAAIESGRLDPLLIAVGPALHDARHTARTAGERARRAPRDAAIATTALLAFLTTALRGTR